MHPLQVWQDIEHALVAGQPLPDEARRQLAEIVQLVNLAVDERRLSPQRAAAEAARVAGLTPAAVRSYRAQRRAENYGAWFEMARQTPEKSEHAAERIGAAAGVSPRQVFRWAERIPDRVREIIMSRFS